MTRVTNPVSRRSGLALTAAVLLAMAVLTGLGVWQLQRLAWKQDVIAMRERAVSAEPVSLADIEAGIENGFDVEVLRTSATGYYRHDLERHVYELRKGKTGWRIVTPFVIPGQYIILADRGFVPDEDKEPAARPHSVRVAALTPGIKTKPRTQWPQPVRISGYVRVHGDSGGLFIPDNDPASNRWYSYDIAAMSATFPDDLGFVAPDSYAAMLPVFLQLEPGGEPGSAGLPVIDPLNTRVTNNHLHYALTWFALAGVLAVVAVAYWRKTRREAGQP